MRRSVGIVGVLLFALLMQPRASDAGLVEFIWGLSGPQMLGPGFGCTFTFQWNLEDCKVGQRKAPPEHAAARTGRGPFLFIGGAYLFSTGHDSKTQQYGWFDTHLLAFEPAVTVRSKGASRHDRLRIYHGAGISYDFLFGQHFRRFDKFGFSATPIEVQYKHIGVGLRLRYYPNGFTDDEFGFGPRLSYDRPAETTYGFTLNWIFHKGPWRS